MSSSSSQAESLRASPSAAPALVIDEQQAMLLTALHEVGLVALTHTPSPMNFLAEILERPENERAYLSIPFGFPSNDCEVPDIDRKKLEEILVEFSEKK